MKKITLFIIFTIIFQFLKAQDEKGFKKENLFTGGSVTASFFSNGSLLGASPIFGYKIKKWFDAGAVVNFTYSGQRDYLTINDKVRQYIYGTGVFARIYPISFLYLQAQPEYNFISSKYISNSSTTQNAKSKQQAGSLLLGGGYTQGRNPNSNTFFYVSILGDVLKNKNSPYVSVVTDNNGNQSTRMVPIFRAGVNIGLFEKNNKRQQTRGGY